MLLIPRPSLPILRHLGNNFGSVRTFSRTSPCLRGTGLTSIKPLNIWNWREKRDIPRCGTEYGPLTDLPDWSYEDGRPGVLTRGQRFRLDYNEQRAQQINFLVSEVDSAVNTHAANQQEITEERQRIIKNKLREKGAPFTGTTDKLPPAGRNTQ